jgi:nitroimidazol reductase NimA-like FMN-containing flavoprotein (pyridoxamine 5'-phosphate oxidase superfamily)
VALSREEREQFLSEPHIGALAVDAGEGRAPLSVPVWYQYEPGGDLWILTGRDSRKGRLIAAAERFTLLADRTEPTVRYVSVEGPVTSTVPASPEAAREMVTRYLAPDKVEPYLEFAAGNHGAQVVIRMRPEHWFSSDLGRL